MVAGKSQSCSPLQSYSGPLWYWHCHVIWYPAVPAPNQRQLRPWIAGQNLINIHNNGGLYTPSDEGLDFTTFFPVFGEGIKCQFQTLTNLVSIAISVPMLSVFFSVKVRPYSRLSYLVSKVPVLPVSVLDEPDVENSRHCKTCFSTSSFTNPKQVFCWNISLAALPSQHMMVEYTLA